MDPLQFEERCPNSRRLSNAVLLDHKFIMTRRGYASVIPHKDSQVEGVLYELTEADEEKLAKKHVVFHPKPSELWRLILRTKGPQYRLLAELPDNLSHN